MHCWHHWFGAREYQRNRGVPHYHLLIGGVGDVGRGEAWTWWFDRFGFARILLTKQKNAAASICVSMSRKSWTILSFLITWRWANSQIGSYVIVLT
jgi:hypothetical protein